MDTKPILGPPRPVDWLCLASLAALWGSSFAVIEIGLRGLTPTWLVAVRIGVAVCLLNLLRRSRGLALPPLRGGPWGRLAALAVFGNLLPFLLISWGQREVESGVAGVLMATTPLLTLGLAHRFVPGEGITARKTLGFPLALVGVALLLGVAPGNVDRVGGWHQGAVLLGAGCYAANTVLARRLPAMPLLTTASAVFLLAFAVALPVAGALDGFAVTTNSGVALGAAIWLGVGPTALATLVHLRVVRSAGAAFASSTSYLIPIVALAIGAVAFGEAIEPHTVAALGMILGGIALGTRQRAAPCSRRRSAATPSRERSANTRRAA